LDWCKTQLNCVAQVTLKHVLANTLSDQIS